MSEVARGSVGRALLNLVTRPALDPYAGFIGTFMARDALALAARYLDISQTDAVLLPGYLCKEVLRPFAGRSRLLFYDVGNDLSADPDLIKSWLVRERVRLLVVINYFGFLQPGLEALRLLCANHGTVLLEDCAHSLLTRGSGNTGDLSVVSYRKLLPVFDGGGLKIKRGAAGFTIPYHPRLYSNALSVLATAKAISGLRSDSLSRAGAADRLAKSEAGVRSDSKVLPLSWFTANGAANAPVAEIVARKRFDYAFWQEIASSSAGLTPVTSGLGEGVCPLGFPVLADDRDGWMRTLERAGVLAKVHWRLPAGAGDECANSQRMSELMMTLPVSPELTAEAKARVTKAASRGWR